MNKTDYGENSQENKIVQDEYSSISSEKNKRGRPTGKPETSDNDITNLYDDNLDPALRIKAFRKAMNYTQAKAASVTKTPLRTWQTYEQGQRTATPALIELCKYVVKHGPLSE